MCCPCVWQQMCAISWDLLAPVQYNHQYIWVDPHSELLEKVPVKPKNTVFSECYHTRAPVCQSASLPQLARAAIFESISVVRAPVLPERQSHRKADNSLRSNANGQHHLSCSFAYLCSFAAVTNYNDQVRTTLIFSNLSWPILL